MASNWFTSFLVTFQEQVVWCIRCSFVASNLNSLYKRNSKRHANICNEHELRLFYMYCCWMNPARVCVLCRFSPGQTRAFACSSSYCNAAVVASLLFATKHTDENWKWKYYFHMRRDRSIVHGLGLVTPVHCSEIPRPKMENTPKIRMKRAGDS